MKLLRQPQHAEVVALSSGDSSWHERSRWRDYCALGG